MESRLFVYHYIKSSALPGPKLPFDDADTNTNPHVMLFETCLRKIWISYEDLESLVVDKTVFETLEVLKEDEAYGFLLEVICGLKSPLIGETEVFGQFKTQVLKNLGAKNPLLKVIFSLVADTKNIRSQHLKNLGSSSYGSLARKHLVGFKYLDILGAGQFVQSLKPWIEKLDIHTNVYTRSPENYANLFASSSWVLQPIKAFAPKQPSHKKALFVCAPMDMTGFDLSLYDLVIDFRDVELVGDINHPNLKVLTEVFQEIAKDNLLAEQKKHDALISIEQASQLYITAMNHRPFGWDDLSA